MSQTPRPKQSTPQERTFSARVTPYQGLRFALYDKYEAGGLVIILGPQWNRRLTPRQHPSTLGPQISTLRRGSATSLLILIHILDQVHFVLNVQLRLVGKFSLSRSPLIPTVIQRIIFPLTPWQNGRKS